MSRDEARQKLALEFGATGIVTGRGDDGAARIEELTGGRGAHSVYLPELITLIGDRTIDPGRVFDLELPLREAADGYRAVDERRATKALLRP